MSRKAKLLFAAGCGAAGIFATALFAKHFSGDVQVVFAGVPPKSTNAVYFSVTNSFRSGLIYYLEDQVEANGVWPSNRLGFSRTTFRYSNYTGKITGRAAETIEVKFNGTNRWRLFVLYRDSWSTSWIGRTHAQIARQTARLGWRRLSQWLHPKSGFVRAPSPVMLGNKPEPPDV